MNCRQSDARRSSRRAAAELAGFDMPGRALDLGGRELQPQLRRLVHGLEEQLVRMRPLLGRLLQARAGRPCAGSARSPTRPCRAGSARRSPRASRSPPACGAYFPCDERPLLRRGPSSGCPRSRRSRCGCGRRRSTSSSDRSTCSARARRSGSRSRRTACGRSSSTGRPAREDDARADRRGRDRRGVRGALGRVGDRRAGA